MRVTKSMIRDLGIFMVGFGVLIGIVFPFFVILFGVDIHVATSPIFVAACICAGIIVGVVNIALSRIIVIQRMEKTTEKMIMIRDNVTKVAQGLQYTKCDYSVCQLPVDSHDAIGKNAEAYNRLVETLSVTMSGQEWLSRLDAKTLSDLALGQIMESTNSEAGCVFIEKEGEVRIVSSFGIKGGEELAKNKTVLSVATNHKPIGITLPDDIMIDGVLLQIRPKEVRIEPLLFNNVQIGVILVASTRSYDSGSIERLRIHMKSLSLALHNAITHEQIRELAAIDPLTGVFNRRFGMDRLADEMSRSYRNDSPLGIAMMDLDHFKAVNDNFGHLAGDRVLVTCAKILRSILRDGDIVLRYGGEEFLLLLPGASYKDMYDITDKIRRVIEETVIQYGDYAIKITCSMGIVSIPEIPLIGQDVILSEVDKALYRAKENGRNGISEVKI